MTPTHIEVLRCTGACLGTTDCTPLKTVMREISVMLGNCGISEGMCEKQCATVTVEEHMECGCSCKLKQDDCRPKKHRLNSAKCECECENENAKRLCLDQGRLWDENSCTCGCPSSNLCSSESTYSNVTCQCDING